MDMLEKIELVKNYQLRQLEEDVDYSINLGLHLGALYTVISDFTDTFEGRTEIFFVLFKEILRRGHLKLQKDNQIIEHTPEEWEAIFRAVWPNSDSPYGAYEGDIGLWFTDERCPAYAVWVDPDDGSLYWST